MYFQVLIIVVSLFSSINYETINESFSIRALPDNAWILKFENNKTYEYYHWNDWGGTHILEKGKYELENGVIKLKSTERDKTYKNEIPRKLFYTKMSQKEFEKLEDKIIAYNEKKLILQKRYVVISKKKLKINQQK